MTGPRGRSVCWSILWSAMSEAPESAAWDRVWEAAHKGDLSGHADELATTVTMVDLDELAASADELTLLTALAYAVDTATYWQEPGQEDLSLRDDGIRQALLPIARAVAESPGARWWAEPVARETQQVVLWADDDEGQPLLSGAGQKLTAWRSETLDEERSAARRPSDPAAPWSGHWWSAPVNSRLVDTTRALPGLGALGLVLVEDGLGWTRAWCQPVSPRPGARVFEVTGPDDWAQLVASYPLDVTRSRRHDWWRVTGWAGSWLIPDYAAVAADYDAIHLTVLGYLTAADRCLPVEDARTMLAGWDPDATYWLADFLAPAGPTSRWEQLDENPVRWTHVTDGADSR